MIESILFKSLDIVFPEQVLEGDVLVQDGVIKKIDASLSDDAELVIKEKGLTLMPGCIDPHVHFRDPGLTYKEDLESGSKAAASGGITTFFDMPNTNPQTITLEAMAEKKLVASQKSLINYNFFMGATNDNLNDLIKAQNIAGIKIFVGSSTGNMLVNNEVLLKHIFQKTNQLIAVHSEDEGLINENKERLNNELEPITHLKIREAKAAETCTQMLIHLALDTGARLHVCHLTTAEEVSLFRQLGKSSQITTEVTPHHLFLSAPEIYKKWGACAICNPPIREKYHQQALFQALKDGVISSIGSDHAPHLPEEKSRPYPDAPAGIPGVETTLPLLLNQVNQDRFSLNDVSKWTSLNPAKLFDIQLKGQLKEGFDGDFVLVDLKQKRKIEAKQFNSKSKWSIFEGVECTGWPLATFVNGQMVWREGDFFEDVKGREVKIGQ